MGKIGEQFEKLVEILATLRGPNGCPWDKEQTYKNLNPYMLEEVHEILEAIDKNDFEELKEELGDLMMHICFHSQLATEDKHFTIESVLQTINDKMVRRHPHVFGKTQADTSKEVLKNWEVIKEEERANRKKERKSLLEGLPKGLPSLVTALRMGEKASRVGFDWKNSEGPLEKIEEEIGELKAELKNGSAESLEHEIGDVLQAVANLARHLNIDPETALRKSCGRFEERFAKIEKEVRLQKKKFQDLTFDEWDRLWNKAKAD